MADEQRDRGPVDEGNGGPVTPGAQPPHGGTHGTGSNGANGSESATLVKPGQVGPDQVRPEQARPDQARPDQARPDQVEPVDPETAKPLPDVKVPGGRISGVWVALTLSAVVLIFLLIFIVQNNVDVPIRFLGLAGTLPLGVALLLAAALGMLLAAIPGYGRILQLRRALRKRGTR